MVKTIVIIGAGSGVGFAVAQRFGREVLANVVRCFDKMSA